MTELAISPSRVLSEGVREKLARTFDIQGLRLTYTAGRWVMDGRVPSYRLKKEAGVAVAGLVGQMRMLNRLRVVPQGRRSDRELEEAARAALLRQPALSLESILVSVRGGVVFLNGRVPSSAASYEARAAVWTLRGVVDVVQNLQIEPEGASSRSAGGGVAEVA